MERTVTPGMGAVDGMRFSVQAAERDGKANSILVFVGVSQGKPSLGTVPETLHVEVWREKKHVASFETPRMAKDTVPFNMRAAGGGIFSFKLSREYIVESWVVIVASNGNIILNLKDWLNTSAYLQ